MNRSSNKMDMIRRYGLLGILAIEIIIFSFGSQYFLTVNNILNVLRQSAVTGICAVGMTFVMLTGGIDLSMGAVVGIASISCASLMVKASWHPVAATALALLVGLAIGLLNGVLVTYVGIPPLIATLGVQTSIRGLCYILTGGLPVYGFPNSFGVIGKGYVGFVPVPVIIMIVFLIIGAYVLNKTRFGRYLYAIGGNAEASRLSGIDVSKSMVKTYVIAGLLAAIAGIVELSRLSSGQPAAGDGYEMTIITAVVLGGISVAGGEGKFFGVVVGIFIMAILSNGLVMMNVYEFYQQLIRGIVLLVAVGIDQISKKGAGKKKKSAATAV